MLACGLYLSLFIKELSGSTEAFNGTLDSKETAISYWVIGSTARQSTFIFYNRKALGHVLGRMIEFRAHSGCINLMDSISYRH